MFFTTKEEITSKNNVGQTVGIDLGTTNSAMAIEVLNVEVIPNCEGDELTPSVVSNISKGEYKVGKEAINQKKLEPKHTAYAVKRLIGRNLYSEAVQNYLQNNLFTYKVEEQKDTVGEISVTLGEKQHSPEEISAQILKKIKQDGENFLKRKIEKAVITVPAYFNDKAKYATLEAARLAGLKVERLLPEPTAAAISFDIYDLNSNDQNQGRTVLVYDFGGGTFDCSVLNIVDGNFIEMGKSGDMWLGGNDIDQLISKFALEETAKEYKLTLDELKELIEVLPDRERLRFQGELTEQAEQCKIKLSKHPEADFSILGLLKSKTGEVIDVDVIFTQADFKQLVAPIAEKTIGICEELIESLGLTKDLIDHYFLVGGTVQIAEIVEQMKKSFSEDKVIVSSDPMMAIARGAAILANRLNHADSQKQKLEVIHSAAHDYYLELANKKELLIVEENTPLPCSMEYELKLQDKDQSFVHFRFFNKVNKQKEYVGDLWLSFDLKNEISNRAFNRSTYEQFKQMSLKLSEPANLILKIEINEDNLFKISAHLKEFPNIKIAKTLSRGKHEEQIYLDIEKEINGNFVGKTLEKSKLDNVLRTLAHGASQVDSYLNENNGIWPGKKHEDKIRQFIQLGKDLLKKDHRDSVLSLIDFSKQMVGLNWDYIPPNIKKTILTKINRLEEQYFNGPSLKELSPLVEDLNAYIDESLAGVASYHSMKKSKYYLEQNSPGDSTINYLKSDCNKILETLKTGNLEQAEDLANQLQSAYSFGAMESKNFTFHKDVELV